MTYERATTLRCWECERETDAPHTVILHADRRVFQAVTLCPACYRACYLPLAVDGARSPLLEAQAILSGR
jgi:hypothetical protein